MIKAVPLPHLHTAEDLTDVCDRCGANAKLHVALPDGRTLAFCGHHANRYAAQIVPLAAHLVLETGFAWRGLDSVEK